MPDVAGNATPGYEVIVGGQLTSAGGTSAVAPLWAALVARLNQQLGRRVGFLNPHGWPGCEVGWLLARDDWGHGYAHEAARAAIDHGRAQLGVTELISLIRPDNRRSIVLAERLGATLDRKFEFMGAPVLLYRHPMP